MYLYVFNYSTNQIDFYSGFPDDVDNVEDYLDTILGYHLSEIAWMINDKPAEVNGYELVGNMKKPTTMHTI